MKDDNMNNAPALTEEEMQERKKIRKAALIKMVAMFIFCIVVMIFGSIAWFTMNKDVSGAGMGVSTKTIGFKLKSKGTIPMDAAYTAATEYKNGIPDDAENPEFYYTGENNDDVKWRMELSSDERLEPGECGELTFWVIPDRANTSLDMNFSASMRGFTKQGNSWTESTNTTALGYLDTHLLYFTERYPTPANGATEFSYKGLINPDFTKLALTESDPVTIYWVWPNTFKQMMYMDGDAALGGAKGIAYDAAALAEIQEYVSDNYTRMFPSGTADLATNIANCCGTTATAEQKAASITVLDSAYNTADTVIGGAFQGALTELTAEPIAEHEITSP